MERLKEASESTRIESELHTNRDRNTIIHNVEEAGIEPDARRNDVEFVNKLFSDVLYLSIDIKDVARLGRKRGIKGTHKCL